MSQEHSSPHHELDAKGLTCPMPLLKAKLTLNDMQSGEVLKVIATDPASQRDFSAFAKLAGHDLSTEHAEEVFVFYLTKA